MPKPNFQINFLDHVAIRVQDLEASAQWYEQVLGLQRYAPKEWQPFPIFLLAGKTGVALFPASTPSSGSGEIPPGIRIDHFAFQVSREAFAQAQAHYESLGLNYNIQDHHYFHSIYTKDPDGHTVELTTLVVSEHSFYANDKA